MIDESVYTKAFCEKYPEKCGKELIKSTAVHREILIFNNRSLFLFLGISTSMFAFMFGLGSTILDITADTVYFFDLWSVAHIFIGSSIFFLIIVVYPKPIYVAIIDTTILILYEGLEEIMRIFNFIVSFSSEIWYNIIGDIVSDISGVILAYILVSIIIKLKNDKLIK